MAGRNLNTTNEMLGAYSGADGVKTGYTGQAGRCLVMSATRNKMRIISVVLNCASRSVRAQSSRLILDHAFNNYSLCNLLDPAENMGNLSVIKGKSNFVPIIPVEGIEMPLTQEEKNSIEADICLYNEKLTAPVHSNIEVGYIKFTAKGKIIAQASLKTNSSVDRKLFSDYYKDVVKIWYKLIKNK
jgi:D-alanyl-D-alanine carboxypeptidase (penicillin-binding protein 5/6)